MMTGESHSILKKSKEEVIGGTLLLDGNIKMIAQKVGEETVLSTLLNWLKVPKIISLTYNASVTRSVLFLCLLF